MSPCMVLLVQFHAVIPFSLCWLPNFVLQCYEKLQREIRTEQGLGIEYDEDVVCDVCRSVSSIPAFVSTAAPDAGAGQAFASQELSFIQKVN